MRPWSCYWGAAASLSLPVSLLFTAFKAGSRHELLARAGLGLPRVEPGSLWIHAASLGEGSVAAALIEGLSQRDPELPILRTATSIGGARQSCGADVSTLLPLDIPFFQRRFTGLVRPRALLLVEAELWPGLLRACWGRIPVGVLGARVGAKTRRFSSSFPGFFRELVGMVGSWSARDDEAADFYAGFLGYRPPVIGDLKRDAPLKASPLRAERPVLIAGSTHAPEERLLLDALEKLAEPPLLLLAPRHPERFDEVERELASRGERLRWARRSGLVGEEIPRELDVLLLDSMGELGALYAIGRAAFVGGTFLESVGGHSPVEAGRAGLPLLHGPYTQANASSYEGFRAFPCVRPEELGASIERALRAGVQPVPVSGQLEAALDWATPLLRAPMPPERALRPLLWPLVPLYSGLGSLRRLLLRPDRVSVPVLGVGSLASGGTGKSPVTLHLARMLRDRGHRPALLFRGYLREEKGPALRIGAPGATCSARSLGDEAAVAAREGFLVVSCPDRAAGARAAIERGATILLLDDGLQQRRLALDARVFVVDAREPLAGGPIPVGERREGLERLRQADLVWVNHGELPGVLLAHVREETPRVEARYRLDGLVDAEHRLLSLESARAVRVAFAGIARPGAFFRLLRALGLRLAERRIFPDHHPYLPAELQDLRSLSGGAPLVTTEKDLARVLELDPEFPCFAARLALDIVGGGPALDGWLDSVAGSDRNS